jgi:hypothetical protein
MWPATLLFIGFLVSSRSRCSLKIRISNSERRAIFTPHQTSGDVSFCAAMRGGGENRNPSSKSYHTLGWHRASSKGLTLSVLMWVGFDRHRDKQVLRRGS